MQLLKKEVLKINEINAHRRSLVIVFAESDYSVRLSVEYELKKDYHLIFSCTNCSEIDQVLKQQTPDLLIFGNLSELSYLESYRKYAHEFPDLCIILLTNESHINKFFQEWAISKGVYDVLSSSASNLPQLREKLQKINFLSKEPERENLENINEAANSEPVLQSLESAITYQQALNALNQITDFSKKYFGEMVLGNYWKKAIASLISEHPWLEGWSIGYTGLISYSDSSNDLLTTSELSILKLWAKEFIKECDRIISDYKSILQNSKLPFPVNEIITSD